MNVIKPLFANEFAKNVGVKSTEQSIRTISKIIPIGKKNIQIRTKKNGYLNEQIIIKQNPDEYYINKSQKFDSTVEKVYIIRQNLQKAWNQLETNFPRNEINKEIIIFQPNQNFKTIQIIYQLCLPYQRSPSSIKYNKLKSKQSNVISPFISIWPLTLYKDNIELIINDFCNKFDFQNNFKWNNNQINFTTDIFKSGFINRLLFHSMKYCHSIFINNIDDITNFLRIKALWFILTKKYEKNFNLLASIIVLIKLCIIALFSNDSNDLKYSNFDLVQSSLFDFLEKIFNPYQLYYILELYPISKGFHHKFEKPIRLNQELIELKKISNLSKADLNYLESFFQDNSYQLLINLLINEQWGDLEIQNNEENLDKDIDNPHSLPIQKMIQQDLALINSNIPNKVPEWMK